MPEHQQLKGPEGSLVEIAARVMAEAYGHQIPQGSIEVINYDIEYDIIFVEYTNYTDFVTHLPPAKIVTKRLAIEPTMFDKTADSLPVVEMNCRCRICKRDFVPAPSFVIHEHDVNNQSYGPTSIEQTLNTFEFCSSCAGQPVPTSERYL